MYMRVWTLPAFMRSIASHPAAPHGWLTEKNGNRDSIAGGGRDRHNLHMVCQTAVTALPRVACVVCSIINFIIIIIISVMKVQQVDGDVVVVCLPRPVEDSNFQIFSQNSQAAGVVGTF